MKILFISSSFYPEVGGVQKHLENISSELIKRGHEVTILTSSNVKSQANIEKFKGIKVKRLSFIRKRFVGLISIWISLIKNINLFIESDVVHIHDVFIWYLPIRLLLLKKSTFVTLHGWEGTYPIPYNNLIQKKISTQLVNGTIAIGSYIEKYYGIKASMVSYGATDYIKTEDTKKKGILYVGRLENDTGLLKILEILGKLNIHDASFCGDGKLRDECKKFGKVHGFVNPTHSYINAKYCFASGYMTIHEAMAAKCLVFVVYDNPLKLDYYSMTPFAKYIVIGGNSDEIVKKYEYYERNPNKAKKLVDGGYNWVKHQTWDKMVDDYLKLWGINEKNSRKSK